MGDIDQSAVAMEIEIEQMRGRLADEASRPAAAAYPDPASRYRRDVYFSTMVDMMRQQICSARFTPTELREAAILAAIMEEERRHRTLIGFPREPR